jgi:tRNA G18 (ribose-2'-O)-methylase SpoU
MNQQAAGAPRLFTAIPVDSMHDDRLADYRLIADHRALVQKGVFVVEGRLVLARLLTALRFPIRSVLLTDVALAAVRPSLEAHPTAAPIYVVEQSAMNQLVGFNIHRGCLALAGRPARETLAAALTRSHRRIVVLERVSNPDNVGGIFRSAAALGADLVVMGPDCADPLYRKAVRTSMGATLGVPFVNAGPWPRALCDMREAGVAVVALTPRVDAISIREIAPPPGPTALLVGHEGEGLTDGAIEQASVRARIPMTGDVDSLNAASAASIAMYQLWAG